MQFAGGGGGGDAAYMRGRHRIQVELKKLEQEARFLEVRQASSALFLLSTSLIPLLICSAARVAFQKEKITSFHARGRGGGGPVL
jgi:hypothetical protein